LLEGLINVLRQTQKKCFKTNGNLHYNEEKALGQNQTLDPRPSPLNPRPFIFYANFPSPSLKPIFSSRTCHHIEARPDYVV